ncbi:MAG: 4-hydroxybenzoate octaprenyltransferase [Hellea sp.]
MTAPIKDSNNAHWVNRSPLSIRPYLQLSRLDRPVGYWLLALPGWIGLAFATLSHGFAVSDLKWAALILIGAIAMRGAACTYNDIVDQDLDAQVDRTALRPLPAKTVTTRQAWIWTFIQCGGGLLVLLCLPKLAQLISLCSIPLVAAYPFMKRITWWPQLWLGLTFNWAVLVAYAAKTETLSLPLFILYFGLIFWTVGYDTIYACQDIEDDMKIGVKSTARRFGKRVKYGVGISYVICTILVAYSGFGEFFWNSAPSVTYKHWDFLVTTPLILPFFLHLVWQVFTFEPSDGDNALKRFKSNFWAATILIITLLAITFALLA